MLCEIKMTSVISVIGLGYVGLPLAIALARRYKVVGFDVSVSRIDELRAGRDRTNEVDQASLRSSTIHLTSDAKDMEGSDVFIVTVPTPIDSNNEPDLAPLIAASKTIGSVVRKGSIIVFESTVYPGVTEDVCGPVIEQASGMACGSDFFLGYSPERINPGDRLHTVDKITKVVSGQNAKVTELLAEIYGSITSGGVFYAASIKAAEAAKAIENAQRDINIAFINEVTMIFNKIGISVHDVLDASQTKWNFLPFSPGLVGGHCIGVDPYYLARCALDNGHNPEVILSGRRINDRMGEYIAESIARRVPSAAKILILGLTFKENVPDLRNSKVFDVIKGLKSRGLMVDVHDPLADREEALREYGVRLVEQSMASGGYDAIVGAVRHDQYVAFDVDDFARLVRPNGLIGDIKGMWRRTPIPVGMDFWSL